jgi:hypothetical protein
MLLFTTGTGTGAVDTTGSQAESSYGSLEKSLQAITANIASVDALKTSFQSIEKTIIGIADSSLALQRNMGGVVSNTYDFQKRLQSAYKDTLSIGASFQDATDAVAGLADGMGKIVSPSAETVKNMIVLSKVTGMSTKEIGTMVATMVRFGGTQKEAVEKISKMGQEARRAGLDGQKFITAIGKDYNKISGFGFKSGVDGLKKMVEQSMTLRTNVESIGALKLQESVLDPEGAIQAAANFQMLGGAVGKLGDPFQLLYMAQTNVEGLQDELVKSAKSAAMFNKETGQFDVSTQDMYRLREQAKITGANLEDLVNTGREAAKLDYIKEKFNLDGLPEDQQKLISQLATVGKDGKLTVDIPGFGEIEATDEQQLKLALSNKDAQSALAEYQKNATLSDRKIAEQTLTVQERQQITTNEIKNAVLSMMSDTQLKTFTQKTQETNKLLQEKVTEQSKNIADGLTGTYTSVAEAQNTTVDALTVSLPAAIQQVIDGGGITGPISTSNQTAIQGQDMIFTPNDAPQLLAKGKIYEGIVGDEIAIGTNLTDALNKGGGGIGGKIDININLTGSIGGDPGQLSKMFNSPQVQKQIMDTVLYKLNDYKRQQGVIS